MSPGGPCLPRAFVTPLGGPASGLWPSGGRQAPSAAPSPSAAAAVPTCTAASIFSDCFAECSGTINEGAPGPVCGWTFITPFGSLGGEIQFTPGTMSLETAGVNEFPIATKPLDASLSAIFPISGQFSFTEYPSVPNGATTYEIIVTNQDLSQAVMVSFFGDGSAAIQLGPPAGADFYATTWTPNNGAHEVHFSIDGAGVPSLFLDGVPLTLAPPFNTPSSAGSLPANSMNVLWGAGDASSVASPVTGIFLTEGVAGPETEFCCPA